jgi:phosphatidate cytidylyltransferase
VATVLTWYLVGAGGADPRVLEGSSATLLGCGLDRWLGSSAAAMAGIDDGIALVLVAILAAVAYDVGGLFIGRAIGHRPLSHASPNKTVEGLLGGMACALLITIVSVGILGLGPWDGVGAGCCSASAQHWLPRSATCASRCSSVTSA